MTDYVYWVNGSAHFRRRVPKDLVEFLGKDFWRKSLKTRDPKVAKKRAAEYLQDTEEEMARARRALSGGKISKEEIFVFGKRHFDEWRTYNDSLLGQVEQSDQAFLERRRNQSSAPSSLDELNEWLDHQTHTDPSMLRERATAQLESLLGCRERGDYTLVEPYADMEFENAGLPLDRTRDDYLVLCKELLEQEILATRLLAKQAGDAEIAYPDEPYANPGIILATADGKAVSEPLAPDANKTPLELFERFAHDSNEVRGQSALTNIKTALGLLEEVTDRTPIASIGRNQVVDCIDLIGRCPSKYKARLGKKTMREAIEANKDKGLPLNTKATVNKHLSSIRTFFNWAQQRNLVRENPVGTLKVERGKNGEKRRGFTIDELQTIFDAKNFQVPAKQRTWKFWVPLLAAFAGARLGEMCQLHTTDVKRTDGIDWIEITNEGDAQSVKTEPSKRAIPVHPVLVQLGFLDYVKRLKAKGEKQLFPDAPPGAEGRNPYNPVSQWFTYFLKKQNIKKPKISFHSFRHSFKTACRNSGIDRDMRDALQGHKGQSMDEYYGDSFNLKSRDKAMKKLKYDGLKLEHLIG